MERSGLTLSAHCALCGGAVTLQFSGKPLTNPDAEHQAWVCPYCMKKNEGRFPFLLAWVRKGHGPT